VDQSIVNGLRGTDLLLAGMMVQLSLQSKLSRRPSVGSTATLYSFVGEHKNRLVNDWEASRGAAHKVSTGMGVVQGGKNEWGR
jgi:hypothetical protein